MQKQSNFWPEGIAGAVSLTFDDALITQLDNALPCLDDCGLLGTFYVNPGRRSDWEENIPRWQQACSTGHEIGNHTSRHPCSCNFHFDDQFCLERLTLEDIAATVDEAETALDHLFPEQRDRRSFCYPCYQSYVGRGLHRQSYVPLIAQRFRTARGWGERANDPLNIDLSYTWSFALDGHSGEQLIDYIENAAAQGQWAILCMHGIGGQHLSITTPAFRKATDFLASNRSRLWTGTVIDIADYIIDQRRARQ